MTNWDHGTPVDRAELPELINTYLAAHLARDIDDGAIGALVIEPRSPVDAARAGRL